MARDARKAIDTHEQRFQVLFEDSQVAALLDGLRLIRKHG
jgi:hypothetical protein